MVSNILAGAALVLSLVARITAIPTISTKGNKFFDSTGQQFFIKGRSKAENTLYQNHS